MPLLLSAHGGDEIVRERSCLSRQSEMREGGIVEVCMPLGKDQLVGCGVERELLRLPSKNGRLDQLQMRSRLHASNASE